MSNFTNYCSNIDCLLALTPDEIHIHYEQHVAKGTTPIIHSIKSTQDNCQKKINIAIEGLQKQIESLDLKYIMNPEEMIKQEIQKLDKYRQTMIDMINHFYEIQKDKLQHQAKFNTLKVRDASTVIDEIKLVIKQLEGLKKSLNGSNYLNQLNKSLRLDVKGMLDKYKSKLKKTINSKEINPITVHVNEERLHQFDAYLEKVVQVIIHQHELDEDQHELPAIAIHHPQIHHTNTDNNQVMREHQLDISRDKSQQQQESLFSITSPDFYEPQVFKFLHYFVSEDKLMYVLDLGRLPDSRKFNVVELNQDFITPYFHRSISTPDGSIYLSGGSINDNDKNPLIYIFNPVKQCLEGVATMKFPRSSHGMIYCNEYIYVISGFTKGKVLSPTFERFNVQTNEVERLADCMQPANSPTICIYQNKYLYKFGGNQSDGQLVQSIERYDIFKNHWEHIDPKLDEQEVDRFQMLYQYAGGLQISENIIMIFGGYDNENHGTDFTFLLHIDPNDDYENTIVCSYEIPLPVPEGFWNNQVVTLDNKLYVLQNIDIDDHIDEHRRRILCFDGNDWIDYGEGE